MQLVARQTHPDTAFQAPQGLTPDAAVYQGASILNMYATDKRQMRHHIMRFCIAIRFKKCVTTYKMSLHLCLSACCRSSTTMMLSLPSKQHWLVHKRVGSPDGDCVLSECQGYLACLPNELSQELQQQQPQLLSWLPLSRLHESQCRNSAAGRVKCWVDVRADVHPTSEPYLT